MDEFTANSWTHLQELLYAESWRPDIERYRSPYAFRGLTRSGRGLETSLHRLGGDFASMERHLVRNFRKYARLNLVDQDSIWHWLSLAKHHGLPTRMLDWSYSPLVALHFATSDTDTYDEDSIVWMVNYIKARALLPDRLKAAVEEEGAGVFTVEMLGQVVDSLPALDALSDSLFVVFFEPPSLDDRIVNQYALFSLMSNPEADLAVWLENHPHLVRKIIIPAGLKWEVRDKLDQANITERVLFPGLDGLSQWLKRQYSARLTTAEREPPSGSPPSDAPTLRP
ncbi:MAG: FRG domain-containing protein [Chloroflexota bacterium]